MRIWTLCVVAMAAGASPMLAAGVESRLDQIELPPGFSIALYADDVPNARSLTRSNGGVIYVGTRREDVVYALQDTDCDGRADRQRPHDDGHEYSQRDLHARHGVCAVSPRDSPPATVDQDVRGVWLSPSLCCCGTCVVPTPGRRRVLRQPGHVRCPLVVRRSPRPRRGHALQGRRFQFIIAS